MGTTPRIVDLLVVGGGTAGIVGALTAAQLGAKTLMVEKFRPGGDCLWTGCVPSKALASVAGDAALMRAATGQPESFAAVKKRIAAAISAIEAADSPEMLEAAGVRYIQGTVKWLGPGIAEAAGERIEFRQALIATGAVPHAPDIPGLEPGTALNSETIWDLGSLPGRLAIIGGGPLGSEMGQAFARLGSQVTMIIRSRILPREDPEAADIIRGALEADGVRILEHTAILDALARRHGTRIRLAGGEDLEVDKVLIATGRTPRTAGAGFEALGVDLDPGGHVVTDACMRTSNPRIWAAGDVTANPQFTHVAGVQASVAAANAVLGLKRRISATVPRVTFTSPEVAAVGLTHADGNPKHTARTIRHLNLDRAVTQAQTEGFTRLIVDKKGKILGGTIVGPRAGESLAELALAVRQSMSTTDIALTTHAYPTYSDGIWRAAVADVTDRQGTQPMRTVTRTLLRLRRRRLSGPGREPKQP